MNADSIPLFEELLDDIRHAPQLLVGQAGINRQTEALARGLLRDGKIADFVAQVRVAFLEVQRQRVMKRATDSIGFEMLLSSSRRGMAHDVKVPRAFRVRGFAGQLQRRIGQQIGGRCGRWSGVSAPSVPGVSSFTPAPRPETLPSVIEAHFIMVIAHARAVFAQRPGAFVEPGVVGDERAAFAAGSEILPGVKS